MFDPWVVDEWDDVLIRACLIKQRTRMTRHGKTSRKFEKDGIFRDARCEELEMRMRQAARRPGMVGLE